MKKIKRLLAMALLIVSTAAASLSITGMAVAQASPRYDLACWGVMTAGGDVHTIKLAGTQRTRRTLMDSIGQWTIGDSSSPRYNLSSGYMPAFAQNSSSMASGDTIAASSGIELYFPLLQQ